VEELSSDFDEECYQLEYIEREHIIKVLTMWEGNITKSAKMLNVGRNTLYRKIEKYKIDCSEMERCIDMEH